MWIIIITIRFCHNNKVLAYADSQYKFREIIELRDELGSNNAVACDMKTCVTRRGSWAPCTV